MHPLYYLLPPVSNSLCFIVKYSFAAYFGKATRYGRNLIPCCFLGNTVAYTETQSIVLSFSALTLLVTRQEGHLASIKLLLQRP